MNRCFLNSYTDSFMRTGGQGITIKLRKTTERSPTAMLLEAPYQLNSSFPKPEGPPRWRQMK
jgi:hypothetical protein